MRPFADGDEKSSSGIDLGADDPRNIMDAIEADAIPPGKDLKSVQTTSIAYSAPPAGVFLDRRFSGAGSDPPNNASIDSPMLTALPTTHQ